MAALGADQTHHIGKYLIVESGVDGGFEKPHIPAGTGAVLLEFDEQAVGRVSVVVEGVVSDRIAEGRYEHRSRRQLFTNRKGGFAVQEAVECERPPWRGILMISIRERIHTVRMKVVTVI